MMLRKLVVLSILLTALLSPLANRRVLAVEPLANAHSHNDYWRKRPLLDALDHGFTSVEADVFLVDGKLLVGHAREELQPANTLESLYLAPLAGRVREHGGRVFTNGGRFLLLIDIKSDAQPTYEALHALLSNYAPTLSTVEDGKLDERAVTVVISGNRPSIEALTAGDVRYAGLDGRPPDLDSRVPAHVMPLISDNWSSQFSWNGDGPMPTGERTKLQEIVRQAHAAGRAVRFWATPESEAVWRELQSAGVDLINTDQLDRLAAFLRASAAKTSNR